MCLICTKEFKNPVKAKQHVYQVHPMEYGTRTIDLLFKRKTTNIVVSESPQISTQETEANQPEALSSLTSTIASAVEREIPIKTTS